MKIAQVRLYRFRLPVARPLPGKMGKLQHREGLIIELSAESGHIGLGEVSPLPGFSQESLETALGETRGILRSLRGSCLPSSLWPLAGGFDAWLEPYHPAPSVRFGIEAAVLSLLSAVRGLPLGRMFSPNARHIVSLSALLSGSPNDVDRECRSYYERGFRTFKLKVGGSSLDNDIALVHRVRQAIGDGAALRLDANRAWDMGDALAFLRETAGCRIEYIEEPVKTPARLKELCERGDWPVALDESLGEISQDELSVFEGIAAVVLKPTMLGLERALSFARRANALGIGAVVSSSFESGVAAGILLHLAAAVNDSDVAAGLATLDWFTEDLLQRPLPTSRGRVTLSECAAVPKLCRERLEEVRLDG